MPTEKKHDQHTPANSNRGGDEQQQRRMSPSARRHARRAALQAMYQWQIAGTPVADIENEFLQYQLKKEKEIDVAYFKELIHGIPKYQTDIDEAMTAFLERPLAEIDPIELAVLRLAVYELLQRPDVPYRVVINEALELTKKFGSIDGYKFVNSVLDRTAKKIRAVEVAANANKKK